MGSDQSTADEWVEVVGVDDGGTVFPLSLSGWTLTSLGTDGTEKTLVRFGDIMIEAGEYHIISNYPAVQSRLATDPVLTTTAMTFPNTKLLLRLRDASGAIIDEVDDGVGVPFAGANPSGTGAKASMERIDLLAPGTVKENWQTAIGILGFDPGVPIFGTPGFPRTVASSSSEELVASVSSAVVSSSVSSSSLSASKSFSSFSSSCNPDVSNIHIAIQSGEPRGKSKVTVNLQLLWEGGGTLHCLWDYRDGFTSTSCNPTSHTFTIAGTYEVRVEAEDACGRKTVQTLPIEVLPDGENGGSGRGAWRGSGASSSLASCTPWTFAGIEITRFLPNPKREDSGVEWVELRNISDRGASLCGWMLDDGEEGSAPFSLDAITLAPKEIRRFPASLTGLGLNNDRDHVRLFAPQEAGNSLLVQDVPYANARDGVVMDALFPTPGTHGRVVRVIDGDTVVLGIDHREMTVRLLGIDAPEPHGDSEGGRWGQKATEFLRGLLEGAVVSMDFDEERQDVYGRILTYLAVGGHDVQTELLQRGLATVYQRCTCMRKEEYLRLEEEARESRVGMWGDGNEAKDGKDEKEESVPSPLGGGSAIRPRAHGRGGRGGREVQLGSRDEEKNEGRNVMISEVYPVPLPAEGEWVELWNGGEEPLDLSGWKIDDVEDGGSRAWEFPGGFVLQPGAFIVLRSDQTGLAFNNDGDSIALIAPDGALIDRMVYEKLRRGSAFARVIQRMGNTGEFRATNRFCSTTRPTPFERNICGEESLRDGERRRVMVSEKVPVRRVVRLARRVRYRNVLPPGVASGTTIPEDPLLASLLVHMERSVQSGQVVWREEDVPSGGGKTMQWEAILLPFLLVVGAHGMLTGMRRGS